MNILIYLTNNISHFSVTSEQVESLRKKMPSHTIFHAANEDSFLSLLPDAEAIVIWSISHEHLKLASCLKIIATPAAGREAFLNLPIHNLKIIHGSFHGELMAETALGMLLGMNRTIFDAMMSDKLWPRQELVTHARPLRGQHVGIVGWGAIAMWIHKLLIPFDVRITGFKRTPKPENIPLNWRQHDRLLPVQMINDELPFIDHLILLLPSDTGTDLFLSDDRIRLLKKHACVYNLGRGNSIDEHALAAALRENRLRGACLDVFSTEPITVHSPLLNCPRLVRTPHSSAFAPNYLDLFFDELALRIESLV